MQNEIEKFGGKRASQTGEEKVRLKKRNSGIFSLEKESQTGKEKSSQEKTKVRLEKTMSDWNRNLRLK
jgi:hypothetical protein